jgi:signal transduction histidine kinase
VKPDDNLKEMNDRLSKEIDLFSTIVAHDMNNYLQYVFFKIDEIEWALSDSDELISDKIEQLRIILKKMGYILGFFALPSKLTDDPMVYIIEQIAGHVEGIFDGLHITIEVDDREREMRVQGGHLLPMVFANLFMNSVEHGGKEVKVEIRTREKGNQTELIIYDDGPGIDPSIKENLFRKGTSTTGSGLGLYLAREILRIHDGTIEFLDSGNYSGAAFRILLPLVGQ